MNARDENGNTALALAIANKQPVIVDILLQTEGIGINTINAGGYTPLTLAIAHNQPAIVGALLQIEGIDVNAKNNLGYTALSIAAYNKNEAMVNLLLQSKGIDVNAKNNDGETALMNAIDTKNEKIVNLLLQTEGIDVNAQNNDGDTAFIFAVQAEKENIVNLLLQAKDIDVNAKNNNGITAFIGASIQAICTDKMINLLLQIEGVDVNIKADNGTTALIILSHIGKTEIVKALLQKEDIDIKAKIDDGNTALSIAADKNDSRTLAALLEAIFIKLQKLDDLNAFDDFFEIRNAKGLRAEDIDKTKMISQFRLFLAQIQELKSKKNLTDEDFEKIMLTYSQLPDKLKTATFLKYLYSIPELQHPLLYQALKEKNYSHVSLIDQCKGKLNKIDDLLINKPDHLLTEEDTFHNLEVQEIYERYAIFQEAKKYKIDDSHYQDERLAATKLEDVDLQLGEEKFETFSAFLPKYLYKLNKKLPEGSLEGELEGLNRLMHHLDKEPLYVGVPSGEKEKADFYKNLQRAYRQIFSMMQKLTPEEQLIIINDLDEAGHACGERWRAESIKHITNLNIRLGKLKAKENNPDIEINLFKYLLEMRNTLYQKASDQAFKGDYRLNNVHFHDALRFKLNMRKNTNFFGLMGADLLADETLADAKEADVDRLLPVLEDSIEQKYNSTTLMWELHDSLKKIAAVEAPLDVARTYWPDEFYEKLSEETGNILPEAIGEILVQGGYIQAT